MAEAGYFWGGRLASDNSTYVNLISRQLPFIIYLLILYTE